MSFEYPQALFALLLIVPYAVFALSRIAGKMKALHPMVKTRAALSAVLFGLFLLSFIVALAGPRQGSAGALRAYSRDADVVIALDLSRSMDIRDSADGQMLSRLQRGLALALDTVRALPELRFAAAAGRSRGVLTVPLTHDSAAIINFLEALDGDVITGRGTNLESLLDAAAAAFQEESPSRRYILLASDGEALSGSFRSAVERCRRNNITIIALALGSDAPQPVPAGLSGGEPLASSRDTKAMYQAAELSGGIYVDGNRSDAAGIISAYLRSRAPLSDTASAPDSASRWFLFIIIAIVCYGASRLTMLDVKTKKARKLQ